MASHLYSENPFTCRAPTSVCRPDPPLLSFIPEPYQDQGCLLPKFCSLLNRHPCTLSTYIAKVSAPGYSLRGNRSSHVVENAGSRTLQASTELHVPKADMAEKACFLRTLNGVCKAQNVPVVQFPLLFTKVKL